MTEQPPQRLRPTHRFSARTRLAFSYAVLVIICGAVLLTVLVTYLGLGPDYSFGRVGATGEDGSVLIVPDSTHPPGGAEGSEVADGAEGPGGSFSVEVQSREDLITLLITVSVIVLLILAVLSSLVAWWLAGRMLRPLAQINEAAQIAASGRLDHRIGLTGPRDEIVDLAQTFDAMLENIQRYNTAQRRFAANASHELRTPLAASKTILDVARATPVPWIAKYSSDWPNSMRAVVAPWNPCWTWPRPKPAKFRPARWILPRSPRRCLTSTPSPPTSAGYRSPPS